MEFTVIKLLLQALRFAKKRGALCIGITNVVGSAIARETDCGVHVNAGCEIGVASTKAYTSQILVLIMVAVSLCQDRMSKVARCCAVTAALEKLPSAVSEVHCCFALALLYICIVSNCVGAVECIQCF
jgi:glucosamine--fructose-6-phosphate aminotransferase (isomerizing)